MLISDPKQTTKQRRAPQQKSASKKQVTRQESTPQQKVARKLRIASSKKRVSRWVEQQRLYRSPLLEVQPTAYKKDYTKIAPRHSLITKQSLYLEEIKLKLLFEVSEIEPEIYVIKGTYLRKI